MASFFVRDTFRIPGRLYMLAGEITEGLINKGDLIVFETEPQATIVKILGLEILDKTRNPNVELPTATIALAESEVILKMDLINKQINIMPPVTFKDPF